MTIQFQGHVEKIENGTVGEIISIHGEMWWVESNPLVFHVPKEIALQYRPGDPVQITLIPLKRSS